MTIDNPPSQTTKPRTMPPHENLVMRSVFLDIRDDTRLRQLAHERRCSKNELIREAIVRFLRDQEVMNAEPT